MASGRIVATCSPFAFLIRLLTTTAGTALGATRRRMGEEGERLVGLLLSRHRERALLVRRH